MKKWASATSVAVAIFCAAMAQDFRQGVSVLAQQPPAPGATRLLAPMTTNSEPVKYPKLASHLRELVERFRADGPLAARLFAAQRLLQGEENLVRLSVVTSAGAADVVRREVTRVGGRVDRSNGDHLEISLPVEAIEPLAALDDVERIDEPLIATPLDLPMRASDPRRQNETEGVQVTGAGGWASAGLNGTGMKVAILDAGGFEGHADLLGSDLPPAGRVTKRSFRLDGNINAGGKHGTGVAEIVNDVAPGAHLYFANIQTELDLSAAVDWLIAERVDVINFSAGFLCGGPLDGTGAINDKVREATNRNIVWVNSSGNAGKHHWSQVFADPNGNAWHNFSGVDERNRISLSAGDDISVSLQWDDWEATEHDYDLYLFNERDQVVASSRNLQGFGSAFEPVERFRYEVTEGGRYYFAVKERQATRDVMFHLFLNFNATQGQSCAAATALEGTTEEGELVLLRRLRDVVLGRDRLGEAVVDSYYRYSPEVSRLLLLNPSLASEAAGLLASLSPAVQNLVANQPGVLASAHDADTVVSADLVARATRFLDELGSAGSGELRAELAGWRNFARITEAVGLPVTAYWRQLQQRAKIPRKATSTPALQYVSAATSVSVPADSPDVISVGATFHTDDSLEDYSSQGPTAGGSIKPDLMGPSRVCTVTYGQCGGDGFPGTSSAAPHVAGAAALVKQANPTFGRARVRAFLESRARDLGVSGKDNQFGAGRLSLGAAGVELLTNRLLAVERIGSGGGVVESSPSGVSCGSDCSELYAVSTSVSLAAAADAQSVFAGWSGDADCRDGQVVMNADVACTAAFVKRLNVLPSPGTVDLNGDGGADVLLYNPVTGAWSMEFGNRVGSFGRVTGTWSPGWVVQAADFDGNGLADFFLYQPATGAWSKAMNDGAAGFRYFSGVWSPGWQSFVVDLNGDGRSDVFLYSTVSGLWFKCTSLGDGGRDFSYFGGTWSTGWTILPAEFNGDANADLFLYNTVTGQWFRAINVGADFRYEAGLWSPGWSLHAGDFNGDTLTDLFLYGTSGVWFVATNTGPSFAYRRGSWDSGWAVRLAEFNGDGLADLFLYNAVTGQWFEVISTDRGDFRYYNGVWSRGWEVSVTDFNADRRSDVLLYSPLDGSWFQAINFGLGSFTTSAGHWEPSLTTVATRTRTR